MSSLQKASRGSTDLCAKRTETGIQQAVRSHPWRTSAAAWTWPWAQPWTPCPGGSAGAGLGLIDPEVPSHFNLSLVL